MVKPTVNIALIGYGFMGRAHSNALRQVKAFFNPPVEPRLRVLCGRNTQAAQAVADAFGWEEVVGDWREVVSRPDIHVVDIATPGHTHREIAIAAARAGKAILCEKPLANSLAEALEMVDAVVAAGVPNMCNFNYRRTPAVALAAQMLRAGRLGEIFHWRSLFLQSWLVDPNFPLTWRLQKDKAGSGALGDLGSHSIDLARYLVGEIDAVCAMLHTYTPERPLPLKDAGRASVPGTEKGPVTVDDAAWALLRFRNGARGSLEVTRMATGRLTAHTFEVNGREGSLAFDFERLNELRYF
ncbi:MAG: Gfo/Idh/MocA family oxidoreductase, partial [Anaerolineae bacterium]|nr:Gfo/Idh/MocA family oxidoreductase [Anaerolineae bacterium]